MNHETWTEPSETLTRDLPTTVDTAGWRGAYLITLAPTRRPENPCFSKPKDKGRDLPQSTFNCFRTQNSQPRNRSLDETSPLPSLIPRLLASLTQVHIALFPTANTMDQGFQGDDQWPMLPIDFDLEWELMADDWGSG